MINKRKNGVLAVLIVILIIFSGCNAPSSNQPEDDATIIYQGCSVHYLDVGQGDCIFIRLSDGKNMLIDSGDKSDKICEYVIRYLENYSVDTTFTLSFYGENYLENDLVGGIKTCPYIPVGAYSYAVLPMLKDSVNISDLYLSFNAVSYDIISPSSNLIIFNTYYCCYGFYGSHKQ